jgi:serine/threonine protein kinase
MSSTADRLAAALSDRYRIERELGAGGMATVYLAADLKHDRKVALKVLKPELAAVLGADRFVQEIKTTAALQHPHILPLFDSGTADGFLFYVMPFIDGETLRARLDRETQLGVAEAVQIARDVASALHYAHEHGVIHRDIKPENILLHDGRPMVADFGIALAKGFDWATTGTPDLRIHYHANISERIDIDRLDRDRGYCAGEGCAPPTTRYEAGTLVIDVIDARTNRLVWRAWSQKTVKDMLENQDVMARQIDEAVTRMFARFPRPL